MKKPNFQELKNDLSVARHFLKSASSISKSYIPLLIISSLFKAAAPFINIIIPKFIIDELMGAKRPERLAFLVCIIIIGNALFNVVNRFFDARVDVANTAIINGFELRLGKHIMNMEFENLEDPEVLNQKEQALFPIKNQGAMRRLIASIINLLQTTITIIGLIAVISSLNFTIILVIILIVLTNSYILKKTQAAQFKFSQDIIPINRQFQYCSELAGDFSMAKDVRIYNMSHYIIKKVDNFNNRIVDKMEKFFSSIGKLEGVSNINLQIQMIFVYSYMVWKVYIGAIGIGDFQMYISAANNFSSKFSAFLTQFIEFRQMCKYLDLYLQFENIPTRSTYGNKTVENIQKTTIEFKNVYFKYPRSENYTLKNISIKINSGEKLAIVGQNGAGKTTFIKLLCRLYEPEKGKILVNGININEYRFDEYMKLLSIVFQDYKLFSFTIKENLVFDKQSDDEKVVSALKKAGVYSAIETLENGINTSIYKNFDEKGIELSGGQSQKLAIARAIYKDSPIVILDEPTSALDPYAEFEIYSKLNELAQNKTAIYISHRLSSCLLCDKIAVFENGEITEYGTHLQLKENGKKYSEMWNAQAQYYVEDKL